jgi:hypothetical protein
VQVAAIRHYRGSFLKVNVPFVPMLLLQKLQRSGVEDDAVRINFRDISNIDHCRRPWLVLLQSRRGNWHPDKLIYRTATSTISSSGNDRRRHTENRRTNARRN